MAYWELLATNELTSTSDTLIDTTVAEKNFYWIQEIKITSGNARSKYEFNSDSGSNYSERNSDNGGSTATATSQTSLSIYHSGGTADAWHNIYVSNFQDQEKLVIWEIIENNDLGAGFVPHRTTGCGKWSNTADKINEIRVFNDGTGDFNATSQIAIFGQD
jgi:hypothetical protein